MFTYIFSNPNDVLLGVYSKFIDEETEAQTNKELIQGLSCVGPVAEGKEPPTRPRPRKG